VKRAEIYLEEMRTKGIVPTTKTYTAVIHSCAKAGDVQAAEAWAIKMDSEGLLGDCLLYGSLIQALARDGHLGQAEFWLHRAESRGITMTAYAYNAFILAYGRRGDSEGSSRWLRRMLDSGIPPDAYTFVTAVLPLARDGKYRQVLNIKRKLYTPLGESKFLGSPGLDTHGYNCVLLAIKLARPCPIELAEEILSEMAMNGIESDRHTEKHVRKIEMSAGRDGYLTRHSRYHR